MKYFMDAGFIEAGFDQPIHLLSIAIVSEDGRESYSEWGGAPVYMSEVHKERAMAAQMKGDDAKARYVIAADILEFLKGDKDPKFYGYRSEYAWVVFCQLFGKRVELPKNWPKFCFDLAQTEDSLGKVKLPKRDQVPAYNSLSTARWIKLAYDAMNDVWKTGTGRDL